MDMPGGTSFYFSMAMSQLEVSYQLVTSLGSSDSQLLRELRDAGTDMRVYHSVATLYFENIYELNPDQRKQRVLQTADPFSVQQLEDLKASIFHLGPLLAGDFSLDIIKSLAARGKVSLDAQGYLREVRQQQVYPVSWPEKAEALKYVSILKVNEEELEVLTGLSDYRAGAIRLFDMGVKEVVVTLGSKGSLIFDGADFYEIQAFKPAQVVDVTGCGDTYMAGYLYMRVKGAGMKEAGIFASSMASLKIDEGGPFRASVSRIAERMQQ